MVRFGAFVPQGWRMDLTGIPVEEQWGAMVEVARRAEALDFDSVWVYDHFHTTPRPSRESTFECWTTMAGLAQATERVRLGQMVTCNSYRNPAYLAKISSCVDVMSGGRLELGIGAGWYEDEYRGYGYPFPRPSVRIGQMAEAVRIIKRMWTEDRVSFRGTHYSLEGAVNRPKPLQDPHPPVWIGGGGEQLTLRVVAEEADRSNFGGGDLEVFRHKSEVLAGHCRRVGRPFEEIERSCSFDCLLAETEGQVEGRLDRFVPPGRSAGDLRRTGLVGTPARVLERLEAFAREGLSYAILYFPDALEGGGMRLFAEEVAPYLRET